MTKAEEMRMKATGDIRDRKERLGDTYNKALAKIEMYANDGHTTCIVDSDKDLWGDLIDKLQADGFKAYIYRGTACTGRNYYDLRVEW